MASVRLVSEDAMESRMCSRFPKGCDGHGGNLFFLKESFRKGRAVQPRPRYVDVGVQAAARRHA